MMLMIGLLVSECLGSDSFILTSLSEAQSLSKSTKQPILLIFGADYCVHCNYLKQDIKDGDLDDYIHKYIICYLDTKTNSDLVKEYKVTTIPYSLILDPQKTYRLTLKGYSQKEYIEWLNHE
jgi:thioredoxin-related protein